MPGLLADPRTPMQAPVQQFPQQPLMDPLSAQMMLRRFGGAPQGLLDRSNSPAGLLGPPAVRPDVLSRGLLTPVIWDRLQKGLSPMPGTEGGGRGMEGGGGRGFTPEEAPSKSSLKWQTFSGGKTQRAVTKSGLRVIVERDPHDEGAVHVMFHPPALEPVDTAMKGSTKRGIDRFGEVYGALKDYIQGFAPTRLKFIGETKAHDKLYDRVAPLLAKGLGGQFSSSYNPDADVTRYTIDLPQGAK